MQPVREVDYSPPSNVELTNEGIYTFSPYKPQWHGQDCDNSHECIFSLKKLSA